MRACIVVSVLFLLVACGQGSKSNDELLLMRVDSLQKQLAGTYKPGLGEFMLGIQTHHVKLWLAGDAQNWKLADFETGEIKETIDDIKTFNTDRPEVASIGMIGPAIDSITDAIRNKNSVAFKRSFVLLTNTCNNCHVATKHEFNVIKIPEGQEFLNQDFKAKN